MSKVVWHFCFCNMFLQTSLIGYCLTENRLCLTLYWHNLHCHCCPSPPGLIWSRYSLVIIPKNWNLFCVNFFVGGAGACQLFRIWRFVANLPVISSSKCQTKQTGQEIWVFSSSNRYNQDLKEKEKQDTKSWGTVLSPMLHCSGLERRLHTGNNPALAPSHHPILSP